jgi:hypothetical protein
MIIRSHFATGEKQYGGESCGQRENCKTPNPKAPIGNKLKIPSAKYGAIVDFREPIAKVATRQQKEPENQGFLDFFVPFCAFSWQFRSFAIASRPSGLLWG